MHNSFKYFSLSSIFLFLLFLYLLLLFLSFSFCHFSFFPSFLSFPFLFFIFFYFSFFIYLFFFLTVGPPLVSILILFFPLFFFLSYLFPILSFSPPNPGPIAFLISLEDAPASPAQASPLRRLASSLASVPSLPHQLHRLWCLRHLLLPFLSVPVRSSSRRQAGVLLPQGPARSRSWPRAARWTTAAVCTR